jgi:hypothetical protein
MTGDRYPVNECHPPARAVNPETDFLPAKLGEFKKLIIHNS